MTRPDAAVVDVAPGVMATVLPPLTPPVFLRLALPAGGTIDLARREYLRLATAHLRGGTAEWRDGAGVLVTAPPSEALVIEVHARGRALRALGERAVAEGFLDLVVSRIPAADGGGPNDPEGE